MKKLTTAKIWQFAAGQFGWAMLSGIISNWLVYFYQPQMPIPPRILVSSLTPIWRSSILVLKIAARSLTS